MQISLLTVPCELHYTGLIPQGKASTDVFATSIRSNGQLPVMPKIAIVNLIKWMEKNGYTKDQYDFYDVDMLMPSDDEIISYVKEYRPDVIGLSAVVSTCYAQVKRISDLIRKTSPNTWVILGGSLTASANLVLRKTEVDICVVGDGEIAWVDLLHYIKEHGRSWSYDKLSIICGLAYLDASDRLIFTEYGKEIPAEENAFPDYDIFLMGLKKNPEALSNYFRRGLGTTHFKTDPRSHDPNRRPMLAQLWTTKGCVARCTFCQRSTKGCRTFDLTHLDEHLKMLAIKFDVGFVHILDENFGSDNAYARDVAEVMHKNDMLWIASGIRVSSVDYDIIKFFKENSCAALKFGVESGSQKIMDVMEKKFTVDRVFQTLSHCAALKLYSPLAVMVGMPGETNETAAETGRFVGKLSYACGVNPEYGGVSIFYALPLTGTPLYVYGQQAGVIGKTPDEEESYLLSVSGSGASKINYVNLNGASMKDVVWWDWLVQLEARRTYEELVREKGEPHIGFIQERIIEDKKKEVVGAALTIKQVLSAFQYGSLNGVRAKLFFLGDTIMEHKVVPSKMVTLLPRWMIYSILRQLMYLQFKMQGFLLSMTGREFNLWKEWAPINRIDNSIRKKEGVDINASLRRIVRAKDAGKDNLKEAQDVLSIGL